MLPMIAAASIASSLMSGVFSSLAISHSPKPHLSGVDPSRAGDFKGTLGSQMSQPADPMGALNALITLQQGMNGVQPELQIALANQLLNRTVQVVDASGNNVVGTVSSTRMNGGQVFLTVKNHEYPISSLQAVLHQIQGGK